MWTLHDLLMLIVVLILSAALVLASGCGRTVLVREDSPMRTAEAVQCRMYVMIDGVWTRTDGDVLIPEGWYVLPPRFVYPEDFE